MRRIDAFTKILCLAGGITTAAFVLSLSSYVSAPLFLFTLGIMAWTSAPYLLLNKIIEKKASALWKSLLLAVVTVTAAAFGGLVYWTGFYVQPDAQSAFLFLIVPFCQLALILAFLVIRKIIDSALTPRHG